MDVDASRLQAGGAGLVTLAARMAGILVTRAGIIEKLDLRGTAGLEANHQRGRKKLKTCMAQAANARNSIGRRR